MLRTVPLQLPPGALDDTGPSPTGPSGLTDVDGTDPRPSSTADVDSGRSTSSDPAARRGTPAGAQRRPARRVRPPRRAWLALPGTLLLLGLSTFAGWVSAEPAWIALGHGHAGTATVLPGGQPCRASFTERTGAFTASTVDIAGVAPRACTAGARLSARMVSAGAERAYATADHAIAVRWVAGAGLVLLCALLGPWVSGAYRYRGWRRVTAALLSFTAPVALATLMLALAY